MGGARGVAVQRDAVTLNFRHGDNWGWVAGDRFAQVAGSWWLLLL
ncbi:hypothetical protein XCR_0912 [Xanthomonas campestris pv. raphani 756C]|nr:hypothetical protein XCR_0912 [Xanthomonas campestris pv. raphani 756C]